MDDIHIEEYQTHNNLEEATKEVIVGALHHEMVVMSSPQYVISYYEPNSFLKKYSFSKLNQCGSSTYDFDEVCSLPMSFMQDTLSFQFHF